MAPVDLGRPAPEFTLPGLVRTGTQIVRGDYQLAAERGHPLVLAFYPGDNTMVCTRQMCSYSTQLERFEELNAAVWGISPQNLDSHERFASGHQLRMPLLADTDLAVARAYGVVAAGRMLRRSVFVIDGEGVVRWRHVSLVGLTYRDVDTLTRALASLGG